MNIELALQTFLDESRELLADMEHILLDVESRPDEPELQNALFRCVHTVKGSAGMFGLDHVVNFTHVVENVLDRLRAGEIQLSRDLANLLLRCRDHISLLVEVPEPSEASDLEPAGTALLAELEPYQSLSAGTDSQSTQDSAVASEESGLWRVQMRIHADALRHGMDPLGFIRFLGTLGELEQVTVLDQSLPELDAFDPEACYLGFDVSLRSSADRTAIEDVFEFAGDLYQLQIDSTDPLPEPDLPYAEEETRLQESVTKEAVPSDKSADPQQGRRKKPVQHLRIQADKLDNLINLVGELVIASASVSLDAERSGDTVARESAANLNLLVEEIRDSSLNLRMVPIGETFQRFQRVVRDVSSELGKDIELVITGAETELDKTVVEKIADPLTHLVRNACDHGVEMPEKRREKGRGLLRWQSAQLGLVPPNRFIPVAEAAGLMPLIGNWVMKQACHQARQWLDSGTPLRVAVNACAAQLETGDFVESVRQALTEHRLPAYFIEIEITESMLIQQVQGNRDTLRAIRDIGVKLGLDDFGTGYSSLAYLRHFTFDTLKIDRLFVSALTEEKHADVLVRAIVALGQELGHEIIAEGIETEAQKDALIALGCTRMQGFLFGRPVPADELKAQYDGLSPADVRTGIGQA